mgnify:CR=1 FL=1
MSDTDRTAPPALHLTPSGQACGATVTGVDLSQPLAADTVAALRAAWLERAGGLGQNIEAHIGTEVVTGRFSGLDERGALMLDCQDGRRRVISVGDVFFRAA